jgi:hypothetical protein
MKNRVQKKGRMLRGTATQVYPLKKRNVFAMEKCFFLTGAF